MTPIHLPTTAGVCVAQIPFEWGQEPAEGQMDWDVGVGGKSCGPHCTLLPCPPATWPRVAPPGLGSGFAADPWLVSGHGRSCCPELTCVGLGLQQDFTASKLEFLEAGDAFRRSVGAACGGTKRGGVRGWVEWQELEVGKGAGVLLSEF